MNTRESKLMCKIAGPISDDSPPAVVADDLAHIVEVDVDEKFHPWFAVIDAAISDRDVMPLAMSLIAILFEDGRQAKGFCVWATATSSTGQADGREGRLNVVGLTPLEPK